jgi:hypothetical protein
MSDTENRDDEVERLKKQLEWERIRAENLADRAEFRLESELKAQKNKSTEMVAILSVLLICAVIIIISL